MHQYRVTIVMTLLFVLGNQNLKAQLGQGGYTDHHVHLQDSATVQLGYRLLKALDQTPAAMDSMIFDADTILDRLNRTHCKEAWILSNAYWFGSPFTPVENEYEAVKQQNNWTAEQAARYPGRLRALMSVNPLKPYALEEIQRCAESKHFIGIKLHFANSKVDLLNKEQLIRLKKVFALADKNRWVIFIHFRSEEKWKARANTEVLLNQLIPLAKNTKVVLAHMAGWGGYDQSTDIALELIANYIRENGAGSKNIYFDISAVLPVDSDETDHPANIKNNWDAKATLNKRINQIGTDRILFGTDWPLIEIDSYIQLLNAALGTSMVQQIMKNELAITEAE